MTTPTVPFLIGGLFAWTIYRRIRRNIGQQKLRPVRIIISLVILSLASALLILVSLQTAKLLLGIAGGLLVGALLGLAGLRLTRFDTTSEGHFYTPNTGIGVALSVLFLGRMLYRFWVLQDSAAAGQPKAFQSALTCLVFGLIAGYYIVYYIGLFHHTRDRA